MSAFVVDREHINALVRFACQREHVWTDQTLDGGWRFLTMDDADWLGRELWMENVRSVAYRYPDDESGGRPGPYGFSDEDALAYTLPMAAWFRPAASAVGILKAAACLEYQSCEHPGWENSTAHTLLDEIKEAAIRLIPGYEEAEWGTPIDA